MIDLKNLVAYLDEYLCIRSVPDYKGAFNGLQVEGRARVDRIALAVDACIATIETAQQREADMLLVHHGLLWGGNGPVTGNYYRRLAPLLKNDIALYSCHLPLDAHPEVGNNHVLARKLGLTPSGMFGDYEGVPIGIWADTEMTRAEFVGQVERTLGVKANVIPAGPDTVRRVGIITGGGGARIEQAVAAGIDTYLTGEGAHHTYFEAEERGLNLLYAGHYATETIGVRALGDHITARFGVETFFIDHPTGL